MKIQTIILLLLIFQLTPNRTIACSGFGMTPFCNIVTDTLNLYEVVVVNRYNNNSLMDLKIINHINGLDTLSFDTISVAGEAPDCYIGASFFEDGDTLIVSFDALNDYNTETNFPYISFSFFRVEYLVVEGDSIIWSVPSYLENTALQNGFGGIEYGVFSMEYQTFLNQINEDWDCNPFAPITPLEEIEGELRNTFSISPNPTSNNFYIENDFLEKVNYQIFDASGRLMQEGSFFQQNNYEIDLSNFPQGIYFLKIQSGEYFGSEKVVKI